MIVQSLRDLCKGKDDDSILDWVESSCFLVTCKSAGLEPERVEALVMELESLPVRIRQDIMSKRLNRNYLNQDD